MQFGTKFQFMPFDLHCLSTDLNLLPADLYEYRSEAAEESQYAITSANNFKNGLRTVYGSIPSRTAATMRFARIATLFAFASAVWISGSQAQETCLLTPTECQCAVSTPSGTCLRSQGDGTCLLGLCSEGYRCDCFGYERCSISKCGKHVTIGDSVPSETVPFSCQYSPGSGHCTNAVDMLDTVSAANNAESDATASADETTADETDSTMEVKEIQREKKAVIQVLKEVERVADDLPDDELDEIDVDAEVVEDSAEEVAVVALEAVRESRRASKAMRESRKLKREARRADRLAKEKKDRLDREEKKPNKDKALCGRLRVEVDKLRRVQKDKSKGCGRKAKESRDFRRSCNEKRERCGEIKKRAQAASSRCMQKSQKSLGKARGRYRV